MIFTRNHDPQHTGGMQTRFDLFLDAVAEPVLVKDQDSRWIHGNRALAEWLGIDRASLAGRRDEDFSPPEVAALRRSRDLEVLQGVAASEHEETLVNASGERRSFIARRSICRDELHSYVVISFCDLAEKKRLLRDLEESRARQIEASRMVSIGKMSASIAHEINNPLMVIMGKVWQAQQQLKSGHPYQTSEMQRCFEKIGDYAERIGKIVKSLRSFSREGSRDPKTAVSIAELLQDTLTMCGEKFRQRQVTVRLSVPPEEVFVFCRSVQVTQILLNLLSNAYDAVEGQSEQSIEVEVRTIAGLVEIHVSDSGPGVPPEVIPHLFEPFFTTKEPGKGTGLGLSISSNIAAENGGSLRLESARPCRFVLSLPEIPVARQGLDFVV